MIRTILRKFNLTKTFHFIAKISPLLLSYEYIILVRYKHVSWSTYISSLFCSNYSIVISTALPLSSHIVESMLRNAVEMTRLYSKSCFCTSKYLYLGYWMVLVQYGSVIPTINQQKLGKRVNIAKLRPWMKFPWQNLAHPKLKKVPIRRKNPITKWPSIGSRHFRYLKDWRQRKMPIW